MITIASMMINVNAFSILGTYRFFYRFCHVWLYVAYINFDFWCASLRACARFFVHICTSDDPILKGIVAVVKDGVARRAIDHVNAVEDVWRHVVLASASDQMEELFVQIRAQRMSLCGGVGDGSDFQ